MYELLVYSTLLYHLKIIFHISTWSEQIQNDSHQFNLYDLWAKWNAPKRVSSKNRYQIKTASSVQILAFSHRIHFEYNFSCPYIHLNLTRSMEFMHSMRVILVFSEQFIWCELRDGHIDKLLFVAMMCQTDFYYTRKMFSCHIRLKQQWISSWNNEILNILRCKQTNFLCWKKQQTKIKLIKYT